MNFTSPSSLSQDVGNQIRCKQKSCLKKLIGQACYSGRFVGRNITAKLNYIEKVLTIFEKTKS
jgi:hypothetical protein